VVSRESERIGTPRRTSATDENRASTSARSVHGSLPHLWKGSNAAVASEFDALRYCRGADGACCRAPRRLFGTTHEGLRPKRPMPPARGLYESLGFTNLERQGRPETQMLYYERQL
jgi:hypothetical protein